jgi:hypothetical protein
MTPFAQKGFVAIFEKYIRLSSRTKVRDLGFLTESTLSEAEGFEMTPEQYMWRFTYDTPRSLKDAYDDCDPRSAVATFARQLTRP